MKRKLRGSGDIHYLFEAVNFSVLIVSPFHRFESIIYFNFTSIFSVRMGKNRNRFLCLVSKWNRLINAAASIKTSKLLFFSIIFFFVTSSNVSQ